MYDSTANDFRFYVNSNGTLRMQLSETALTVAGHISGSIGYFNTTACTGTILAQTPTAQGVSADVATTYGLMEMAGTDGAFIDFASPNVDYKGRIAYFISANTFSWRVGGVITTIMQLSCSNLQVNGTIVSTSDKRFTFNVKPLANALDAINKLEPVLYDQAYELVYQCAPDTTQSQQYGLIARYVQIVGELKHAVEGGDIGEDGT